MNPIPRNSRAFIKVFKLAFVSCAIVAIIQAAHYQPAIPRKSFSLDIAPDRSNVAFMPDGKFIVTVVSDGEINCCVVFWNSENGERVRSFRLPSGAESIALSPDGKKILTGNQDGNAYLWDAQTGKQILRLGHQQGDKVFPVKAVAYSPNGDLIATANLLGTYIWDASIGKVLLTLNALDGDFSRVVFNPTHDVLITSDSSYYGVSHADVWDIKSGDNLSTLSFKAPFFDIAVSPDGSQIAIATWAGAQVWNLGLNSLVAKIDYEGLEVRTVDYSPDGRFLMLGGETFSMIIRDTVSWKQVAEFGYCGKAPCDFWKAIYSPDAQSALIVQSDRWGGSTEVWDVSRISHP